VLSHILLIATAGGRERLRKGGKTVGVVANGKNEKPIPSKPSPLAKILIKQRSAFFVAAAEGFGRFHKTCAFTD